MRHPVANDRIVRGASTATLSHQFIDGDGEPAAPAGTVTVAVTRSDGTSVTVGAVAGSDTDPRTVSVGAAELTEVDQFTAVWTDDGNDVATDVIDVVGGTVGGVAVLQGIEPSITLEKAPDVLRARRAAENRFVSVTGRLPFLRLEQQWIDSGGTSERLCGAWWPDLVEVRSAWVYTGSTTYTALTAAQLAAIEVPDEQSRFTRRDTCWPCGRILVTYVAGMSSIPDDLRRAFAQAVRREITLFNTGAPDRSETFASDGVVSVGLDRPGKDRAYGIADIDDVFRKYADPRPKVA